MNLEESRNKFLQELSEETKLPVAKIKHLLAQRGVTRYDPTQKSEYRAIVLSDAKMHMRIEDRLFETKPAPCLMPDCEGHRISKPGSWWICTLAGERHYWAVFISGITGEDPKDVYATLTEMKVQQEKRDEEAKALWQEEMQKRQEKEATP